MEKSNSIYKSISIQLVTWPLIVAMLLVLNSCNLTYSGGKNRRKIEKHFGQNALNGDIKISELSKLLHERSRDDSNLMFMDSILTFQNVGILFDSNGYIKDLIGSNYPGLESISLAIDNYNFDRPITIPTSKNKLPKKLGLHFNDLLSIVNVRRSFEVIDSNKTFIFIAPNQTNRAYLKTVKRLNWRKVFGKRDAKLLLIRE